jgi:hypothetical protein
MAGLVPAIPVFYAVTPETWTREKCDAPLWNAFAAFDLPFQHRRESRIS